VHQKNGKKTCVDPWDTLLLNPVNLRNYLLANLKNLVVDAVSMKTFTLTYTIGCESNLTINNRVTWG